MVLPSSTKNSDDIHPTNTASAFQIRLQCKMYLRNKYEVALAEMTYLHTWSTFNYVEDYTFICSDVKGVVHTLKIPHGYYKTMAGIISKLNDSIVDHEDCAGNAVFMYDAISGKSKLHTRNNCTIMLSQGLADVLGFDSNTAYSETVEAPYIADINRGFHSLYVYCSICEPQIVGDAYVPLLRTVYITGSQGDTVNKIYESPHYVPVNTDTLDTIEVNIKNDMNELVSFKTGKVICKLHFRQKAL